LVDSNDCLKLLVGTEHQIDRYIIFDNYTISFAYELNIYTLRLQWKPVIK
jgi:hypothetical protein